MSAAMKRKLLDAALVVFATALFVRLTIAFAPYGFHLPRYLREDSNATMVISAALALALGMSILLPRIAHSRLTIYVAIVVFGIAVAFLLARVLHGSSQQQDIFDKITWDDGKP